MTADGRSAAPGGEPPVEAGVRVLLAWARGRLAKGAENPALEAEVLLAHAWGRPRSHLRAWPETSPGAPVGARFRDLVQRRGRGEPVAYLLGRQEFWSLALEVTPATLIPRPETESLVERALERLPPGAALEVADLGTGSGAVALALATERPPARVLATDSSADALAVAERNARRLGLENVRFARGHWCDALGAMRFHLIVSNPPYLREDDPHLEHGDLRFEPPRALRAGAHGLAALEAIAAGARSRLEPGGWLVLEHGYDQGETVPALLRARGYVEVCDYPDLAGVPRVACGRRPNGS